MRDAGYCPVKQIRVTTNTVAEVIISREFCFTTLWRVNVVRFTQGPYTTGAVRVVSGVTKCLYIKKNTNCFTYIAIIRHRNTFCLILNLLLFNPFLYLLVWALGGAYLLLVGSLELGGVGYKEESSLLLWMSIFFSCMSMPHGITHSSSGGRGH